MATAGYFHDFTPAEHKETTVTGSICGAFLLVSLARKTNCYFGPICCYFIWLHLTGKSIQTHFISEKKLLLLGINNTRRLTSRWPEAKNIVGNRSIQAFFFFVFLFFFFPLGKAQMPDTLPLPVPTLSPIFLIFLSLRLLSLSIHMHRIGLHSDIEISAA